MDQHPTTSRVHNVSSVNTRGRGRPRGVRGGRGRAVARVRQASRLVNQALADALEAEQGRNDAYAALLPPPAQLEEAEEPLAERPVPRPRLLAPVPLAEMPVPVGDAAAGPPPGLILGEMPNPVPPQAPPPRPPGLNIVQTGERRVVVLAGIESESGPEYHLERPATELFAEARKSQPADLLEQLVASLQLEMKGTIRKADHQQVASRRAKQILAEMSPNLPPKERLGLVSAAVNQVVGITPTEEGYRRAAGGLGVRNPKFPEQVDSWQQANELANGRIYYQRPRSALMRICTLGLVNNYDRWRQKPSVVALLGPHRMEVATMPK